MTEHQHTNRLIHETSPYLLQHAHNPVDWYPWCDEALDRARREDKPILLSIGYSACHWCHVMEHESFEDETVATFMNENFINIKVDREERPDLDHIYMNAVQLMTGSGGWPLTVWLTPDGQPFFGGTYFPPEDRYNRSGFPRVLETVRDAYRNRRQDVLDNARIVVDRLHTQLKQPDKLDAIDVGLLDQAFGASCGTIRLESRRIWPGTQVSAEHDHQLSAPLPPPNRVRPVSPDGNPLTRQDGAWRYL